MRKPLYTWKMLVFSIYYTGYIHRYCFVNNSHYGCNKNTGFSHIFFNTKIPLNINSMYIIKGSFHYSCVANSRVSHSCMFKCFYFTKSLYAFFYYKYM